MESPCISSEKLKEMITAFVLSNQAFEEFGSHNVSIYFIGSLAHGGFSEFCSDIDIACIFNDHVTIHEAEKIIFEFQKMVLPFSNDRLSIFWGTCASINSSESEFGRFPLLDKLDLIEYGHLFFGRECRSQLIRPSHKDLLIDSCQFALNRLFKDKNILNKILNPVLLVNDLRMMTKLILFPARFIYTAQTGDVAINHVSVEYFIQNQPDDSGIIQLLKYAEHVRMTGILSDKKEALNLLFKYLAPLYKIYIGIYKGLMTSYGQFSLVSDLENWNAHFDE